jgi:dTDP-glucose 4,6-dehydratase
MKIVVTGGCGFIGSHFIRHILKKYPDYELTNLDALTYAGNRESLIDIESEKRYKFVHGRIEDPEIVFDVLKGYDIVVNFAAESHVDRSIIDVQPFLTTNVVGLQILIDAVRKQDIQKFIHLSTDEVYGSLETDDGFFTEKSPLSPNSPYSASKAAGDLLLHAYANTYNFPSIIVRPSNNYGPYQFPEKLIPLMVTNLIDGKPVPLYGKGLNVRDWLYVGDTCSAIDVIMHRGRSGEVYNIGSSNERRNIDVARKVLFLMDRGEDALEFVPDRPGHDYRYAVDFEKLASELDWTPSLTFDQGIEKMVKWYRDNGWWWKPLKERLETESKGFWTEKR